MIPFITFDELAAALKTELSNNDLLLASLAVNGACEAVRSYTGQTINLVEDDMVRMSGNGRQTLLLPEVPVVSISSIEVDGEPDTDETHVDQAGGIIYRESPWPRGFFNIQIVYTHGWAPTPDEVVEPDESGGPIPLVPEDLRLIAIGAAVNIFQNTDTAGLTQETLGSYSRSISRESRQIIEPDALRVLDRYKTRKVPVA